MALRFDAMADGEAELRDCLVLAEFIRSVAPKVLALQTICLPRFMLPAQLRPVIWGSKCASSRGRLSGGSWAGAL